ncbi:MAG: two-component regulator propeller domain-containing protein [Candidatus Omnitrophota bacterium]
MRDTVIIWLGFWIIVLTQINVNASQGNDIRFKHLSIADGLSQSAVTCMIQDGLGFMWFGTQNGLNRYDGYNFKVYTNEQNKETSISDSFVTAMITDRYGNLWIGTKSGGLNKFDRAHDCFTRYMHNPNDSRSLSNNEVTMICEDRSGKLWIGTRDGQLNRFDPKSNTFTHYAIHNNAVYGNSANVIYESNDKLWIGSDNGLFTFEPNTRVFKKSESLKQIRVNAIWEDRSGILWIGTNGSGLIKFNCETNRVTDLYSKDSKTLSDNRIRCIYKDKEGRLWVGTQDGLNLLDKDKNEFIQYKNSPTEKFSLSINDVLSIVQDRSGILWLGTYGGGLNVYDHDFQRFNLYNNEGGKPDGLSSNTVWFIHEDKNGILWVGTYGEGLNRLDRKTGQYKKYLNKNDIRCIVEDDKGMFWLGTYDAGFLKFDPQKGNVLAWYGKEQGLSDNRVVTICVGQPGVLWIGTYGGGLNIFDSKNRTFKVFNQRNSGLSNDQIRKIVKDKDGTLWIGTDGGGVNRFDPIREVFTIYNRHLKKLSNDRIRTIYIDGRTLWIGTDGGLNQLTDREMGTLVSYGIKEGLPNQTVYGILGDKKGNLWMSTDKGISMFNPKTKLFKNYDIEDGLQSLEFNSGAYYKNQRTSEMFFGGINGFNAFFPADIKDDSYLPPVVITDFLLFNKSVKLKSEDPNSPLDKSIIETTQITLNYEQNMFSFEFAALAFSNPNKNIYKYQLKGYDNEWLTTNSKIRRATYTNLKPGNYTFMVRGANKDWKWNEVYTSIDIKILPSFWNSWGAYLLYFSILFSLALWFIWSQHTKVSREKELSNELDQKVRERTRELNLKNEALEKINLIVKSINTETELQKLLNTILKETKIIRGVDRAGVLIWDSEKSMFYFKTVTGWDFQKMSAFTMTSKEVEERYLKESDEIYEDIFVAKNVVERRMSDHFAKGNVELAKSMLIAQIRLDNITQAYFIFYNMTDENAFDDQDILLLKNLKEHFVTAFHKAMLIARLEESYQKLKNAQDQLIHAEKMASLGTLLAGVAHELNNPATAIMLNSEFFSKAWQDVVSFMDQYKPKNENPLIANIPFNEAKAGIDQLIVGLLDGSRRIKNMVNELKYFSSKDDGYKMEPVHINKIIESAVNLTHNSIRKSTQRFSLELGDYIPELQGNFQRLVQVFINLIQNACQALPDDSKGISISTSYNKQSNEIRVRVKDEGEGIEEQNLNHVMDPFFTTKRNIGGTGLGLAICHKIICDEHQGKMKFTSTPGKGTKVSIHLPVKSVKKK